MKKLLQMFLEQHFDVNYSNEKFDYRLNKNSSIDFFLNEFKKFLGMYNIVFYNKNRFVTAFNKHEIRIKREDLNHLFELYNYADMYNQKEERDLLTEYLFTYFKTIHTREYRDNYSDFQKSIDDFESLLRSKKLEKFYILFLDICYDFYKDLISYALEEESYISMEIINRIFNNLSSNTDYQQYFVNKLIQKKKNLYSIIKFDVEKKAHFEQYFNYIIEMLSSDKGGYNYANKILVELDKSGCLKQENLKVVINIYIEKTNFLCDKLKNKQSSFIQGLQEIENLKEDILFLLKNIESKNDIQNKKIKQCLIRILSLKRYLISDDNYVESEMKEQSFEINVKSEEIKQCINSIIENKYRIYNISTMNFYKQLEIALEMYANYPIESLISRCIIDGKNQMYYLNIEDEVADNNFKRIFDQIGRNYTNAHPELLNKLDQNYYEELLKYLSKTFLMQQNLIITMLGEKNLRNIVNELKNMISEDLEDDYILIVQNILAIESNIIKLMDKLDVEHYEEGVENINQLVNVFEKDEQIVNGLMYLNYVLYEKSGLNLRNNAMHGTLINTDLRIPLLVSFSGLIFVSWVLNER